MFRLEGFIDDKNVVKVMYQLTGLVHDLKIIPVANAAVKNGVVSAQTNGSMNELFMQYLKQHKITEVTPRQMSEFMVANGRSEKSYSNMLSDLRQAGILKKAPGKLGNKVAYKVVLK